MLLVQTKHWDAATGKLTVYELREGAWIRRFSSIAVSLGSAGLGWGTGFPIDGPQKREGDRRSPAGVFPIEYAFGREIEKRENLKLDFRAAADRDYFIDDTSSMLYNQWLTIPDSLPNDPDAYAGSYERMLRDDHVYDLGMVVRYNMDPVTPGRGSAIFMHIWREPGQPTLGCTAMSYENLRKIVHWLDPAKKPVLIQIPRSELGSLSKWSNLSTIHRNNSLEKPYIFSNI